LTASINLSPDAAVRLTPSFHKRVWGVDDLAPWFPGVSDPSGEKLGEAWFTLESAFPILVKFLFTSANLSVQVHPDGEWGIGKTEMWHILNADPGAKIALGFEEPITAERLRSAALSGEIEQLMRWIPVNPGETYFIPAGTVHALGAGLTICEIQQNSDITYRLYDYGRPRELHLDQGIAATDLNAWRHPGPAGSIAMEDGWQRMAECRHFATHSREINGAFPYRAESSRAELLVCLEGSGTLNGAVCQPGDVWLIPAESGHLQMEAPTKLRLLRTFVP
jgi:mannose-6-phosphate isomerase